MRKIYVELTDAEGEQVEKLAEAHQLSNGQLLKQALRLYAEFDAKIAAGETFSWSGDKQRARELAGPAFSTALAEGEAE